MNEALYDAFVEYGPSLFDGHEIALDLSVGTFYFYGPDADELLRLVAPIMLENEFMKGAECMRRYSEIDDENCRKVTTFLGQILS